MCHLTGSDGPSRASLVQQMIITVSGVWQTGEGRTKHMASLAELGLPGQKMGC